MRRLLIPILLALALTGCASDFGVYANVSEVERLRLVRTLGVDADESGVLLSADTGSGGGGRAVIWRVRAGTLAEAARRLEKNAMKYDANISHTEHVILGEAAARAGIGETLDYVARTMQMRLDTCLFVARGSRAEDLVTGARGEDASVSDMLQSLKKDAPVIYGCGVATCLEAAEALASEGCVLLRAIAPEPSPEWSEEGYTAVAPAGGAVISGDRLLGFTPEEESEAVGLLTGSVSSGCRALDYGGVPVTLLLTGADVRLKPVTEGGRFAFAVDARLRYSLQGAAAPLSVGDGAVRAGLAAAAAEEVRGELTAAIRRAQGFGCDYLGIRRALCAASPGRMAPYREAWRSLFPKMAFTVAVSAVILRTYDLGDPIA